MAIERAPELEQLAKEAADAYRRGDIAALERMFSRDPAVLQVGTDPAEVWEGPDQVLEELRAELASLTEESAEPIQEERRGYRAGDAGWVFTQGKYRLSDGSEIPARGIRIFHREDGEWKLVQSFISIAVPNSALEAGSPLVQALSETPR